MISERQFANGFSGFWSECIPLLTPQVIADFNLNAEILKEGRDRSVRPLVTSGDKSNNDVVAETAFGLFAAAIREGQDVLTLAKNKDLIANIGESATQRIEGLRSHWKMRRKNISTPTEEAIELAKRLQTYFESVAAGEPITVQPRFRGCGVLDSCYGDLFVSKCLYELKMVDRNLRSADLRQVLIYCAVNYRSQQYAINEVSILNPRRGVEFRFSVEQLASRASGKTSAELFHQITDFLFNFETMGQMP